MKRKHLLNSSKNKWKEEKGYWSKFDRRPIYKEAKNEFNLKAIRWASSNSSTRRWRTRPQTSTAHYGQTKNINQAVKSDGFKSYSNNQKAHGVKTNNSFLDVKAIELQRPILKEDYENIYAVSTSNIIENWDSNEKIIPQYNQGTHVGDSIENTTINDQIQILSDNQEEK